MTAHATVTLPLSELQALQQQVAIAEAETVKVRAELAAAKLESPDGKIVTMTAFSRDCLTLARFAVAHCSPEVIVGWPFDVLRRVADGLAGLPDFAIVDRDMAIDLHAFATECEDYERRRQHVTPGVVAPGLSRAPSESSKRMDIVGYDTTTLRGE
jgi:hypothetical protein